MDIFIWLLIGFVAGFLTHWFMTINQKRILKRYRRREKAQQYWSRPVE